MSKSNWISITIAAVATLFVNNTFACTSTSYDYSDAATTYGIARHETNQWQQLGDSWDIDSRYNALNNPGHDDATDDGVSWRTQDIDGSWSDWGTTTELEQGATVQFQFEFNRSLWGNHSFDELKVWLDWDQDNDWDNSDGSDEIITDLTWYKNDDFTDSDECTAERWFFGSYCTSRIYTAEVEVPWSAELGTTWLRARVTCNESLGSDGIMKPYGTLVQGEVEDYMLTIASGTTFTPQTVPVPEPSSLLLMSPALLLLAGRRRKQK